FPRLSHFLFCCATGLLLQLGHDDDGRRLGSTGFFDCVRPIFFAWLVRLSGGCHDLFKSRDGALCCSLVRRVDRCLGCPHLLMQQMIEPNRFHTRSKILRHRARGAAEQADRDGMQPQAFETRCPKTVMLSDASRKRVASLFRAEILPVLHALSVVRSFGAVWVLD